MTAADPHAAAPVLRAGPADASIALALLHGRGARAEEMLRFGAMLAPEAALFAPQAAGASWWPTSFLAPTAQLQPWLDSALAAVGRAVAAATEKAPGRRVVVIGFSQGACLALEHAARAGCAGAVGLSGGLVGTADGDGGPTADLYGHAPKRFDYAGRLDGAPVYLGCHEADPHIPLRRVRESAVAFAALGAAVTTAIHPGAGHGVIEADVAAARAVVAAAS